VTELVPARAPRVRIEPAVPCALVATVAAESAPPPAATANVTVAFWTALPLASVTRTTNGCASGVPTIPVWLLPEAICMTAAGPAIPSELNRTGVLIPVPVAWTWLAPATRPAV